jgi:hypothetical protein
VLGFGTLASRFFFGRLCFSLGIRALVPAVPRESLYPTHAPSTPVAICPVIRLLTDLSQRCSAPLVLATINVFNDASSVGSLSFVFRILTCSRSCPKLFLQRSLPRCLPQQLGAVWDLLLKADPEGPYPHLSRSFTTILFDLLSCCLCSTLEQRNGTCKPFLLNLTHTTA